MAREIRQTAMAEDLIKFVDSRTPKFVAGPRYDREDDVLTFYFSNAESLAWRVDSVLTLFLSLQGDELVGFEIKGVRALLNRIKGIFARRFAHRTVRVSVVILGYYSTCPPPAIKSHLDKLVEKVEDEKFVLSDR